MKEDLVGPNVDLHLYGKKMKYIINSHLLII